MEEFHRIPIVIVEDEDELERFVKGGNQLEEEEREEKSRMDPKDLSNRMKEKGGCCYKEGKFDEALGFYLKALEILDLEQSLSENGRNFELIMGEVVLRSNCIACYVGKKDFNLAISESRKLLDYIKEEGDHHLREKEDLPTLWVNIENKTRYRLSLSLYNSLYCGNKDILHEENSKASIRESFEMIKLVSEYYQESLKVSPPQEISSLYSMVEKTFKAQSFKTSEEEPGKKSSLRDRENQYHITEQGGKTILKQSEPNYLRSYLICFLEEDLESGSYSKSIPSPIPIVNKMSCNNFMEFLKIWQNIYQSNNFLDYYLLFGQIFTKLDKFYNKTEIEGDILERVLERISNILDELKGISPSKTKDKLVSHIFRIVQNLERTPRFDFVALMLTKNFQILDKMVQLRECISEQLFQEIKYFQETQVSKGIQI
ncbi:uncharacterized protein cubi_02432 [Cryptosporidium ubiquitum]|uniref:RNA-polymerase II-associated protein 3-like C-terminal domain-containing protein n=1 Tax=Cryptosporidium ubiquitum TaxID=857276 RepID=A0A1J4MG74_9CRYT|nr:uncharacterized protein cubi_02432 [Cryptosporidium ubiquitum]OII73200.1 hypothetical protein cubi_02432 [Cryptosporidium ubiquitum]